MRKLLIFTALWAILLLALASLTGYLPALQGELKELVSQAVDIPLPDPGCKFDKIMSNPPSKVIWVPGETWLISDLNKMREYFSDSEPNTRQYAQDLVLFALANGTQLDPSLDWVSTLQAKITHLLSTNSRCLQFPTVEEASILPRTQNAGLRAEERQQVVDPGPFQPEPEIVQPTPDIPPDVTVIVAEPPTATPVSEAWEVPTEVPPPPPPPIPTEVVLTEIVQEEPKYTKATPVPLEKIATKAPEIAKATPVPQEVPVVNDPPPPPPPPTPTAVPPTVSDTLTKIATKAPGFKKGP